ncbi:MAG: pyridoxamine 5'-phosphate oxidase family protein [Thermodesulfobacteriota bacterium]|nr:pyridoxamine 5'-phosphate oxidase family protein [Thermodesulfobacteriota bacterium]
MAEMTERIRTLFEKVSIASLSTATKDGIPNSVPVGAKKVIDNETLLISNQYFNKTLENIKANPNVAITFWEGKEGYQIKGTTTIETTGPRYEETAAWIKERGHTCKGILIIKIEEIFGVSPGPGAGKKLV